MGKKGKHETFYSILFYSILFYSILGGINDQKEKYKWPNII
jgi:hypothetical protein